MPYNTLEKKKAHNQKYYKKWYYKHGRNRAIDYLEAITEWEKKNPEKVVARKKLNYSIRIGKVTKPIGCQNCGRKVRLLGHHTDYKFPLIVEWLCGFCHKFK